MPEPTDERNAPAPHADASSMRRWLLAGLLLLALGAAATGMFRQLAGRAARRRAGAARMLGDSDVERQVQALLDEARQAERGTLVLSRSEQILRRFPFLYRLPFVSPPARRTRPRSTYAIAIDLDKLGLPTVPILVQAAACSDSPAVREVAVTALGRLEAEEATSTLSTIVQTDGTTDVRRAAAHALGRIGSRTGSPALFAALQKDSAANVRAAAARSLAKLDDRTAVAPLLAVLRKDTEANVRAAAAQALSELGDPTAVSALLAALARDADSEVRRTAATLPSAPNTPMPDRPPQSVQCPETQSHRQESLMYA